MKTLADRIQYLMTRENITAYELSVKSGLNEATISRLLNGITVKPNIKNIEILSKYFKISRNWIIKGGDIDAENNKNIESNTIESLTINTINTDIMTPERFDRLLTLMEEQQHAITKLIENQNVLANKIPNYNRNELALGGGERATCLKIVHK